MRVLFFSHLRDVVGCSEISLPINVPLNINQFWQRLIEHTPALKTYRDGVRLAKNWDYTDDATLINDGDEIALIPPVSGG